MTIEHAAREYIRLREIWQEKKKAHAVLMLESDCMCTQFNVDLIRHPEKQPRRCFKVHDKEPEEVWGIGYKTGWCDACLETWQAHEAVIYAARRKGRAHANLTRLCATQSKLL